MYSTTKSLDLPYIPIAEVRGFTATSGKYSLTFIELRCIIQTTPPL